MDRRLVCECVRRLDPYTYSHIDVYIVFGLTRVPYLPVAHGQHMLVTFNHTHTHTN